MQDLTTGPITRHLLKTTSFMLVAMVFQTLYFIIDLYWVGRLGTDAIAAVAIAGNWLVLSVLCFTIPGKLVSVFTKDPAVIAYGVEYLQIACISYVPSGLIFVASSMFQAMGNTMPSLIASGTRILLIAGPLMLLSRMPGFQLRWIWLLSVASVFIQVTLSMWLLRWQFRERLNFAAGG